MFKTKVSIEKLSTKQLQTGTKYNHYGKRTGLASFLDNPIIERNRKLEEENFGQGFVRFCSVDGNGQPTKGTINIGGRLFNCDSEGIFTMVDEDYIEKQAEIEKERREYILSILDKAILSDAICATILGTNEKGLLTLLGPGATAEDIIKDPELIKVDARPSAIESYSETGDTYANAIRKIKQVFLAKMPLLSSMTNKSVQQEGK